MSPVMRTWAIVASVVALLLALRGAWPLALACFLLSPAPAWAFAHSRGDAAHAGASWLRAVLVVAGALLLLGVAVLAAGGLPPMHQWRTALFGR